MVLAYHHRARGHAAQVRWIRRRTDTPVAMLPFMFAAELGSREIERLGVELAAQLRRVHRRAAKRQPVTRPLAAPASRDPR